MDEMPDIASLAQLLADTARAKILWVLIDGTMRPAGELAYSANISAQSASTHLAKLVKGGLLHSEAQGRHRYFRIANPEVAHLIENMATLSKVAPPRSPKSPSLARAMPAHFLHARTCYDHLAGEVAVKILDAMLKTKWLTLNGQEYLMTALGEKELSALNVDLTKVKRRVFARVCVDLTERRPHLGGVLGAALLDLFVAKKWIQRSPRSRIVSITPKGNSAFQELFKA
ncbi:ArsR/SmtB family transcription factor [Undibacterium sp. Ren11W]|uniref:ArsR/SmtB family transcription factor n=1 Tax=Undibacterium sp. Ren11W TaxID=3413045 RepID=UPI003BF139FD